MEFIIKNIKTKLFVIEVAVEGILSTLKLYVIFGSELDSDRIPIKSNDIEPICSSVLLLISYNLFY